MISITFATFAGRLTGKNVGRATIGVRKIYVNNFKKVDKLSTAAL